jgi:hypothetical protein
MRRKSLAFTISLLLGIVHYTFAQQGNTISENFTILRKTPVIFTYSDIDEMLNEKVIRSAFDLKLQAGNSKTEVYVSLVADNLIQQAIGIKLNLTTSSFLMAGNPEEVLLSKAPVKLFSFSNLSADGDVSFSYDIFLHAVTKFVQPGNYKFEIVFSTKNL